MGIAQSVKGLLDQACGTLRIGCIQAGIPGIDQSTCIGRRILKAFINQALTKLLVRLQALVPSAGGTVEIGQIGEGDDEALLSIMLPSSIFFGKRVGILATGAGDAGTNRA